MLSSNRLLSIAIILIGVSLLGNLAIIQTAAAPALNSLDALHPYNFAWVDQNMNSTSTSITLLNSTSTNSGQSSISSITTTNSNQTTNSTSTLAATSNSTQTTTSTSSFASSTTIDSADPAVNQNDIITTTTVTASTTRYGKHTKTLGSGTGYSISFSPPYWLCTDVQVTFTGPLIESGLYGDTLQFQYFQYSPSYPSVLNPIFTDSGLTVTSDTVNYWINFNEYGPVNFAYMPNIAVKVVDVTPKPNGYTPGQIFLELTNITPEGYQSCQITPPAPIPEFQAEWMMIMVSMALGLVFLQAHKKKYNHKARLAPRNSPSSQALVKISSETEQVWDATTLPAIE